MCAETGITLDQYKRVVPSLVKQGWIVTRRGLFKNKVTPFLRLTDRGQLLANRLVSHATNPLVSLTTNLIDCTESTAESTDTIALATSTPVATSEQTEIHEETGDTEYGEQEQGQKAVKEEEEVKAEADTGETANTVEVQGTLAPKGWLMKASEILNKQKSARQGSLGSFWKSRMTLIHGGFQPNLTGKELGQLKQLSKKLGDQTRPVIDYALNHWWKFASRAGAAAGTSFPADPNIGFLLKHSAVAMNLLMPEVTTPPPPVEPVQLIATGTEQVEVHTLTSQELTELLDGLKSP
jgi:DNA-binding MarR family transcriptional regulator